MTPTLIFDGDCSFCTSVAKHFEKRSFTPLAIAPWQRANLAAFGLTEAEACAQVYLVRDGQLYGGAEAFAELMHLQGDPFHRLVAWGMRLPGIRRLMAWGYQLIARNRHRLPGGTPACKLEPARIES
jgi:predicted DCC family thiol-disulfide oxidoreductase YuxK